MSKPPRERPYGIVDADARRTMTGLAFVQGLADGSLPMNTMARTLGYEIAEVSNGRVIVTARPDAEQLNPEGTVHGGFVATLLDTCMGLAVRSTLGRARLHHARV